MSMINLEKEGDYVLALIKNASWFPYRTGTLKFHATQGFLLDKNCYVIHFDSTVAPYIQYLEEGTRPHDIPRAFGYPLPFGIGGRFDGKFHPGSTKHVGFIKDKSVNAIIEYFETNFRGVVSVR